MSCRIGIDVGGTFTDLLLFDEASGAIHLHKTPSTPEDQSIGILKGLTELLELSATDRASVGAVLHGTTVPTNIVLEEKGARVGLLVTQNFEQVLHLARSQTPGPLAGWMIMIKPDPLADLVDTRGIVERIDARGEIVTPLDDAQARAAVRELLDNGVESITVSLLHSYANPVHEQALKRIVEESVSSGAERVPASLSSEILPEFREYERALVTVMNAYVRPPMRRYLAQLQAKLREAQLNASVNIVRSDGGLMSVDGAADSPVYTMLSGPAGGVSGAAFVASLAGHPDALALDMGGTSTDVSLIRGGEPTIARQTALGAYPIKVPAVEVHSVGAGGGSIAHVPMTGALRVGPESAGAQPGPACYGRGGTEPTVTDANVVLGRLPPSLLGGGMSLDVAASEAAVGALARTLGLDLHQAAQGILDIVNENMLGALRLVSVQKGLDPRDFSLVAFGGAGPLHGNAMGILAGCYPVIVPPTPGVLSALGFLYSDVRNEFAQTFIRVLGEVDANVLVHRLDALTAEARAWLGSEGIAADRQGLRTEVDVRYLRQGYEIALEVAASDLAAGGELQRLGDRFGELHQRLYGFKVDAPIEIVNLRVIGTGRVTKLELPRKAAGSGDAAGAEIERRQVYFDGQFLQAGVYDRERLGPGARIEGPAIVTQTDSTVLVHPGHVGVVDQHLNILINPAEHGRH